MHTIVRSGLLACAALAAFGAVLPAPATAAEEISLTIMDTDVPLAGMQVEVFYSDGSQSGITDDQGLNISFEVDPFRRHCLLNALDDIGLTLEHDDKITAFEASRS